MAEQDPQSVFNNRRTLSDLFFGLSGTDTVQAVQGLDRLLAGDGELIGTPLADQIFGLAAADTINGLEGSDRIQAGAGDDTVNGGLNRDFIFGEIGVDVLNGNEGDDFMDGGDGNDILNGELDRDKLFGGNGDDFLNGGKNDDLMSGGAGDDILFWANGDGSDILSGGEGRDTARVDGSVTQGDNFVLGRTDNSKALFERVGLDNQAGVGRFTLNVDTSEIFEVNSDEGDDTFQINDLTDTGVTQVKFNGGNGNDTFDASNSSVAIKSRGGAGDDVIRGSRFDDVLLGSEGVDNLTGGEGRDRFTFVDNPFANGTPTTAANGINVLNRPDILTDFSVKDDTFGLSGRDLNLKELRFAENKSNNLDNGNVLNLTDGFANAAAAAKAIADNNAVTEKEGVFLYFNTTLGITRLVHSTNLAEGGDISVLANLTSQKSLSDQTNFDANNFVLT